MATRDVDLILDTDRQVMARAFDDPTPTNLCERLGGALVKDDKLNLNVFIGKFSGGHFVTSDHSGGTIQATVRRPWAEPQDGSMNWSVGASSVTGTEFPLSADTFEQLLNSLSVVQTDVTSVTVWKDGPSYFVQGADDADLTAISIDELNAVPVCAATVSTVQAGTTANKEVQVVTIAEAALANATSWSDIVTPVAACTITEVQAGSASIPEIQDVEIVGYPDSGVVVASGPTSGSINWNIADSDATIKNAFNTDTASLVTKVETLSRGGGSYKWRIFFAVGSDRTAITANFYGTEYHGVTATLDLNTNNLINVFGYYGSLDSLKAEFQFRIQDTDTNTLYREEIKLDRGIIDASTASALDAANTLTYLALSDTPSTFTASKVLSVNSGATAVEHLKGFTGADSNVVTGTAGTANNLVKWNGDGDVVEAASISDDGNKVTLSKQGYSAAVALTSSAASVAVNANLGNAFTHTLTESTTIAAPSNLQAGAAYAFQITQAAAGGPWTCSWNAVFRFPNGVNPTMPTTASSILVVEGRCFDGTNLDMTYASSFS